jgi:hypothetical protein
MNVFICHTPLHVLITALEMPKLEDTDTLLFVVEDVLGIHDLAKTMLTPSHTTITMVMLSGTALRSNSASAIAIQKQNSKKIRETISGLPIERIFIFFDQRAEAQAILNYCFQNKPSVIWLEDGITTYTIASPFPRPVRRLLKHKLRFDMAWKGSRWLGQHPMIDEIRCFYPDLLRNDLKKKKIEPLTRELDKRYLTAFSNFYGPPRHDQKTGIIVVPHPDGGLSSQQINDFISEAIAYLHSINALPILKFHPRDETTVSRIISFTHGIEIAEQNFPLELMLFVEKKVKIIIGYRTSALHVTSALLPSVLPLYYESPYATDSEKWITFFEKTSVLPLSQ